MTIWVLLFSLLSIVGEVFLTMYSIHLFTIFGEELFMSAGTKIQYFLSVLTMVSGVLFFAASTILFILKKKNLIPFFSSLLFSAVFSLLLIISMSKSNHKTIAKNILNNYPNLSHASFENRFQCTGLSSFGCVYGCCDSIIGQFLYLGFERGDLKLIIFTISVFVGSLGLLVLHILQKKSETPQ